MGSPHVGPIWTLDLTAWVVKRDLVKSCKRRPKATLSSGCRAIRGAVAGAARRCPAISGAGFRPTYLLLRGGQLPVDPPFETV